MQSGVRVIPEEEASQDPVVPREQATQPMRRRRACRKSTGRRPPRTSHSPVTKSVIAVSPPPATQPVMTQMPQEMDDKAEVLESIEQPREVTTAGRRDPAVSRKRKRRVVDFFSSTSPEPQSNLDRDQGDETPRAVDVEQGSAINQAVVGNGHGSSSPLRSPHLAGLVTQLPVSSMDVDEEFPPSDPTVATHQVMKLAGEVEIDSSLPEAEGNPSSARDIEMTAGTADNMNSLQPRRQLWELEDDEEGLSEAEFDLAALLGG